MSELEDLLPLPETCSNRQNSGDQELVRQLSRVPGSYQVVSSAYVLCRLDHVPWIVPHHLLGQAELDSLVGKQEPFTPEGRYAAPKLQPRSLDTRAGGQLKLQTLGKGVRRQACSGNKNKKDVIISTPNVTFCDPEHFFRPPRLLFRPPRLLFRPLRFFSDPRCSFFDPRGYFCDPRSYFFDPRGYFSDP